MAASDPNQTQFLSPVMGESIGLKDDHSIHGDSSSDSEYQHALEVVFDPQNNHRRKASIAGADAPEFARRQAEQQKNTACFVHSLLEKHRKPGRKSKELVDIAEDHAKSRQIPPEGMAQGDSTYSRHLTKKQLSQMAWGVRELSKKLGSLKLKLKVKTVFLLTKAHDESLISNTRQVTEWLLSKERDTPYIVYVEDTLEHNRIFDAKSLTAEDLSLEGRLKYWNNGLTAKHPHTFDFIISLGGDGTVLYASWLFQRIVPPVLSFAMGSLGFLTKFDFGKFEETLSSAFKDGVAVSLRLRFECSIMRSQPRPGRGPRDLVEELIGDEPDDGHSHKPEKTFSILNDIVVDRGPNPTMSTVEIFGDDEHFTTVQADGICVATPTGSTAYNLAAGGSLCHPENPVILVTAICAHTLSFRPIILPDTIVLRVGVPYDARGSSWASFDGRERVELQPGDYVTVSASRFPFANVMPRGRRSEDWINSISRTLQWNSRQKQKAFKEWTEDEEKGEDKKIEAS